MDHGLIGLIERASLALRRMRMDDRGVTAVEYGVIAALILVTCITAIGFLGNSVFNNLYLQIANATQNAVSR